ncbi:MAG TPA: nuclear transport factor 2 family protein [Solirubrobacterales bacterium]|nr:nuclear transport factor 2 family protein [Solirubrobacterales bacterium]
MPEPLEKLKALYEAWAHGDYSGSSDIFDPKMKMETFGMGEPMRADSYEGFVDAMREWLSAWERPITIEAEEFVEAGDRVLVLITWIGRGKGSGAQIESRGAHLWTFRDGLVVHYGVYRDRDEARAALEAG